MKGKMKYYGSFIILIILMVVTMYYIFKGQSIFYVMDVVRNVNPLFLVIGLGMMILYIGGEAFNTYTIMKVLKKKLSLIKCIGYSLVGFYFSSITPSSTGGQPVQMYYMSKNRIHISHSSLCFLIMSVVYQLVTLLYGGMIIVLNYSFVMNNLGNLKYLLLVGLLINLVFVVVVISLIFSKKRVTNIINWIVIHLVKWRMIKNGSNIKYKVEKQIAEYLNGLDYMKRNPIVLLKVFLSTIFQLTVLFLVPYFVYRSFGFDKYGMFDFISTQALLTIAVSAIPIPGAVGVSENGFINLFKIFFASNLILPAMLLSRVISYYGMLIISGIGFVIVHMISNKKRDNDCRKKMILGKLYSLKLKTAMYSKVGALKIQSLNIKVKRKGQCIES